MKEMEERLPGKRFMRVHKSSIVALNKIVGIEGNLVHLANVATGIPIGESYKAVLMERIKNKLI
jgi:two-component system LytT family response regulator